MIIQKPFYYYRQYRMVIAFCICCLMGSVSGALYISRFSVASMMRLLEFPQMSIVTGFIIAALPFIVFYICIRFSVYYLIFPLAFIRTFIFMYCFGGLSLAYADAGWLIRFLLLFSDFVSVPMLIWYTVSKLLQKPKLNDPYIWICLGCIFAVRCIDSFVISPFAWELLRI